MNEQKEGIPKRMTDHDLLLAQASSLWRPRGFRPNVEAAGVTEGLLVTPNVDEHPLKKGEVKIEVNNTRGA